jgi:hypothetical protein
MIPSKVVPMIASLEDATMAARPRNSASAFWRTNEPAMLPLLSVTVPITPC